MVTNDWCRSFACALTKECLSDSNLKRAIHGYHKFVPVNKRLVDINDFTHYQIQAKGK